MYVESFTVAELSFLYWEATWKIRNKPSLFAVATSWEGIHGKKSAPGYDVPTWGRGAEQWEAALSLPFLTTGAGESSAEILKPFHRLGITTSKKMRSDPVF